MIEPVDLYHPSEDVEVVQEDRVALEVGEEEEVAVGGGAVEEVMVRIMVEVEVLLVYL